MGKRSKPQFLNFKRVNNNRKQRGGVYAVAGSLLFALSCNGQLNPPEAFSVNCQACHILDQQQVGPSLIEIAGLYPISKQADFIKWCVEPGRKRPQMAQMPAMAHVPEAELREIHAYLLSVTKGKSERIIAITDAYKNSPTATARPRVVRTFLPETGPASILFALDTEKKHNLVWDTDKCRLRYISEGEVDNYPYLIRNGNDLAKVGEIIYTEEPLFAGDVKAQFRGYALNKDGYPTLHYTIGDVKIAETLSVQEGVITRRLKANGNMPKLNKLEVNDKLNIDAKVSGKTLELTYTPK